MIDKEEILIRGLLNSCEHVYYSKEKESEYFYYYIPGCASSIIIESPQINGIKFTIKNSDKNDNEEIASYLINDWNKCENLIEPIFKKLQCQKNEQMSGPEGLDFHEFYFDIFKKVLAKEVLPKGYTAKKVGQEEEQEFEVYEESTKRTHTIKIGRALYENSNKINTLLGVVEIIVIIDTGLVRPIYNNTTRTMYLVIPGYEIKKYPILKDKMGEAEIEESIDLFMKKIKTLNDAGLNKTVQYIMLSDNLKENSTEVIKKNKI